MFIEPQQLVSPVCFQCSVDDNSEQAGMTLPSHFTGTNTGAPLFLTKNTTNFAGLVLSALRPTI